MKSIILIRHVKSDWSNILSDFDRPVREDRKEDATLIAKEIASKKAIPQYVIISPAIRTLQTAKLLCAKWDYPPENIATEKSLYECTARDILALIKKTDQKYDSIAIVCHNPAITDFVNQYSDALIDNVPTTGAVRITFDAPDWKGINGKGKLDWILLPKEMKAKRDKR
jgi:phosphohistidine phosphatase